MANKITKGEKMWIKSFTEINSSKLKEVGGIIDADIDKADIRRFSDYLTSTRNMEVMQNVQKEVSDIQQLDNLYVVAVTPTKGEYKGMNEILLLINAGKSELLENPVGAQYIDIGVINEDANSKEDAFKLDSKIEKDLEQALKGAVDEETAKKEFGAETLDDLVDKLKKDKNLLPKSKKEIRERTQEVGGELDEEKLEEKSDEELADEKRGEKLIPEGQKDVIETILIAKGASKADLKQVTIVTNPTELAASSDKDNINANGGPVVVLTLRNKEANTRTDRMIAIQDNKVTDTREMDSKMKDFIVRHGEDSSVINSVEEQYIEFKDSNGEPQKERLIGIEESDINFVEQKYNELVLKRDQMLQEIDDSELTPLEIAQERTNILGNFRAEVSQLQNETGIILEDIDESSLNDVNRAVELEEKEQLKELGKDAVDFVGSVGTAILGIEQEDDGVDPRDTRNGGTSRPI